MKLLLCFAVVSALYHFSTAEDDNICHAQSFGADSFVCVCDIDHCDYMFDVVIPEPGIFVHIASNQEEARFWSFEGREDPEQLGNTTITIDHAQSYQRMNGLGGAFTDSAGMNILSLPPLLQLKAISSYFGSDGIDYKLARIPIAGSDFSVRPYSYDDVEGDVDLEFFELQEEDLVYKIPLIEMALQLARHQIRLFGSPWAPPAWMKENGMANGTGGLLEEYREPYAQYLVKFVEEYERNNISIWGLTPQNEPLTGFEDWPWNTCAFSADEMHIFIRDFLGPALTDAGLGEIDLLILDHNRDAIPDYPSVTLEDPLASSFVSGIAVHWYADDSVGPVVLQELHDLFPTKYILYTEACEGYNAPEDERVILGSWERAENYAANIIEDFNNHVTGWVDWNLALDMQGGPNWASNFVDAPIIVDAENEVFYRQPTYYALGHFSKFVLQGSDRIYSRVEGSDAIKTVAFHDPNRVTVVIILNTSDEVESVSIKSYTGLFINIEMWPRSIETVLFS